MKRLGHQVHENLPGKLIVLEGLDGAGTTTQAEMLYHRLMLEGYPAHLTRQPSEGPVGKLIRERLAGSADYLDNEALALLFAADRVEHQQREVIPMLAQGMRVVSDRWVHSSLVYQGITCTREWVWEINREALVPDLTLWIDTSPKAALQRRAEARRTAELFDDASFQVRVRNNYTHVMGLLARAHEHRIAHVDGDGTVDDVARAVASHALELRAPS